VIALDALALVFMVVLLAVAIGLLVFVLADELARADQAIQDRRRIEAAEREVGQIADDTQAAIYRLAQLRALVEGEQEES
jgi:hypothetical protein